MCFSAPASFIAGTALSVIGVAALKRTESKSEIPFALIPLLMFCRNRGIMGGLVNHRLTTAVAMVVVALIVSLNVFLLYQTFFA